MADIKFFKHKFMLSVLKQKFFLEGQEVERTSKSKT